MAIALVMDFDASANVDVMSLYDQANVLMDTKASPPDGLLFHWGAKSSRGLRVVDVWESQGHFDRFFQEKLGPTSQKLNLPQPSVEKFEVRNIIGSGALV